MLYARNILITRKLSTQIVLRTKEQVIKRLVITRLQIIKTQTPRQYKVINSTAPSEGHRGIFRSAFLLARNYLALKLSSVIMDSRTSDIRLSECVRGMKELNREAFVKTIQLPGFKVPVKKIGVAKRTFKNDIVKIPMLNPVVALAEDDLQYHTHKLILLKPEKYKEKTSLTADRVEFLEHQCEVDLSSFTLYDANLTYENWTAEEILRAVLPENLKNVTGFSIIGHIIHLNLREGYEDYKKLIGQVLLEKIPVAKTVLNKSDVIDNTYRNFQMEFLAGEDNMNATVKEHGNAFQFDFSKVYWNPRLSTEHQRVASKIKQNDVVFDVFAGVGPFAIPAAKNGGTVYANDLNPESFKWLQSNIKLNKIKTELRTYNMDGRDFIQDVIRSELRVIWRNKEFDNTIHVVMNLPALAIEFLDAFKSLLEGSVNEFKDADINLPIINCYCFSKDENATRDVCDRVNSTIGSTVATEKNVRFVRKVAPNKDMMVVSFKLTKDVLLGPEYMKIKEPPTKKLCLSPECSSIN